MNSSRLRPLRLRLRTATQRDVRAEKIARRVEDREIARLPAKSSNRRRRSSNA